MSGLKQFFQRFLPPGATMEHDNQSCASTDKDRNIISSYDQSLTHTIDVAAAAASHNNNQDVDDQEDDNNNSEGSYSSSINDNDDVDHDELPEYTEGVLDYKEWKHRRNDILSQFLSRRMFPQDDDDDDGDDESEDDSEDSEEEEEDSSRAEEEGCPESQQVGGPESQDNNNGHVQQQQKAMTAAERKKRRKHIPHMEETVHDVSLLDDIDLYARESTIQLAQVTKVFGLRHTKRFAVTGAYGPRYQPLVRGGTAAGSNGASNNNSSNAMPRLLNLPVDCDGPLSTVYKQGVVNLEVSQLFTTQASGASGATPITATTTSTSRQKMRIFFYDQYATYLDECLKGFDPKTHVLLVAMQRIPAISIFPYAYPNWYSQQEMSDFCVCLGGESAMKAEMGENDRMVRPRFDSDDMRIVVARGNKKTGEFEEFAFQKSTGRDDELLEEHTSTLSVLFRAWQERWNMPVLGAGRSDDAPEPSRETTAGASAATAAAREERATSEPTGTETREERTSAQSTATTSPRLRSAPEQPAGLPNAKRPRALAEYVRMSDLRPLLESQRAIQAQTNIGASQQCQANMYGVVMGFCAPFRTKRGDWMLNVTLADESSIRGDNEGSNENEEDKAKALPPVSLIIFCKGKNRLPDLRRAGEILRLHRVVVQEYQEEIQLRAQRSTGFAVYRGSSNNAQFDPTAMSSPGKYTFGAGDAQRFHSLWKWGRFCLAHYPTIKGSERRTLEQVLHQDDSRVATSDTEQDLIGDYTVMITAILPFPENLSTHMSPCGFLRVWDGTGVSDSDRYPIAALAPQQLNDDPPSQALVEISKIKECREGCPPLKVPERLCGRVLNVVVWEQPHWDALTDQNNVKIGGFIRLRNVQESFFQEIGVRCLRVASKSWVTPLPPRTYEVLELLADHSKRISSNHPMNPNSGVLPLDRSNHQENNDSDTDGELARRPAITTYSSLSHLVGERAGSIFTGNVRIEATLPMVSQEADIGDLCPGVRGSETRGYRFAVCLNDGIRSVMAIVSDAVGAQLFGMSAEEASGNRSNTAYEVLSCIQDRRQWKAEVRSGVMGGEKYFLLNSITLV